LTVAAVIVVPDPAVAVSDADGVSAIRRLVQAAWAGGALPIIVVTHGGDEGSRVGTELAGLAATLVQPADVAPGARWFGRGLVEAAATVTETTAGLLWPCRYAWVDPETVTSLIEAHGASPDAIVRPTYSGEPGFPILVPTGLSRRFSEEATLHAYELVGALLEEGAAGRTLELGDPGITHDVAIPRATLPVYQGPPDPAAGPPPEWNADLAARVEG
jgi:CTP:molybdopterin cytidylyltransferase MocA